MASDNSKPHRKNIADEYAAEIIRQLKEGTAPWQKPWKAGEFHMPFNPASGTNYRGINVAMLAGHGYADPRWMTFKQAQEKGYMVKKGSKSQRVVFWQWQDRQNMLDDHDRPVLDSDGKPVKETVDLARPRLYVYNAFHLSQIQDEKGNDLPPFEAKEPEWNPHERAEAILRGSGASITHDQLDRAFYRIHEDAIHLPPRASFPDEGHYYSTALHELCHWTGHESRMNREFGPKGTEQYSKEELRAEIASWMLCQELGLPYDPGQHVSYVESWVKALEDDPYEIMRACQAAEKIKAKVMDMEQGITMEQGRAEEEPNLFNQPAAAASETAREPAPEKTFLTVPYREKETAKKLGAKWDRNAGLWYAPEGTDLTPLAKFIPEKTPAPAKEISPEAEFAQALEKAGLKIEGLPIIDGKIHRVPVIDGKPGNRDGAYCAYADGRPAGWMMNYRTGGEKVNWVASGQTLTVEQKAAFFLQAEERKAEREAQRQAAQEEAIEKAIDKWLYKSKTGWGEIDSNPYLVKKGVESFGLKEDDKGNLLVPGYDQDGKLRTIQTINAKGDKYFEPGCPKAGAMHIIGEDEENGAPEKLRDIKAPKIYISEGYATGATVLLATNSPVVMAFDANNLKAVAMAVRELHPEANIILCADNDHKTEKNVGLEKAQEAAQAVGGEVISPEFTKEEMAQGLTDFNDLHQARGIGAVRDAFQKQQLGRAAAQVKAAVAPKVGAGMGL
ncbi:ssDNA-binding domain-containing protein [Deltaproteobacteria bacterium OttesenSCG-928-M10]|nr:ssDNA-binding domain-containing protein [Deltaproteobacteria bacterium OttesenSCG-928-M10]